MNAAATGKAAPAPGQLAVGRQGTDALVVRLSGAWRLGDRLPGLDDLRRQLADGPPVRSLAFDTAGLGPWDSGLLAFLARLEALCAEGGVQVQRDGLPAGVRRLLDLASAVPEKAGARRGAARITVLVRIGSAVQEAVAGAGEMVAFLGEAALAFGRLLVGRARFRRSDLFLVIQETGAQALPIVTLISVLVGLILAFVGAVQLRQFGADVYVANLVGLGMAREMGAMMTAIIMAGRTGAAFAAQLGTMQVNEEIDALRTLGFSPMEFLVLPRMLALMLMMPLLCLYADMLGIVGGAVVGTGMLDVTLTEYVNQTRNALDLTDFILGLVKGGVFGVVVAVAGCLRGMQCGRSSAAVGLATTSAVVTGIVLIVVWDSILTVIYDVLGL